MNEIQEMPSINDLTSRKMGAFEFLTFYRNIWVRQAVARTIDVESDIARCEANPLELVISNDPETGAPKKVEARVRLEERKMLVEEALEIVNSIDRIISSSSVAGEDGTMKFSEAVFLEDRWSEEALKVNVELFKKPEAEEEKPEETSEAVEKANAELDKVAKGSEDNKNQDEIAPESDVKPENEETSVEAANEAEIAKQEA